MATTTTTTTTTTSAGPPAETKTTPRIDRRPKDSMKSTWRDAPKSTWNMFHWLLHITNIHPLQQGKEIPIHKKDDPLPYFDQMSGHIWVWTHASWPMLVQYIWQHMTGKPWTATTTFFFYSFAMHFNAIHKIWVIRRISHRVGFLDGDKHARDPVPDIGVMKTVVSLISTVTFRPLIATIFSYRANTLNLQFTWWSFLIELSLYGVILDLFFYTYHRSCHELDGLWRYHRTHHLTKHPNVLLSSYADEEQEFLEIGLIPLLTWATLRFVLRLPMGFHSWWVCHEYVIFSEAFGHSGIRMYSTSVSPINFLLEHLGMELQLEDHDLHHRKGWRKSHNYGKQTRVWDKIFGTMGPRIESVKSLVDWNDPVKMPWY